MECMLIYGNGNDAKVLLVTSHDQNTHTHPSKHETQETHTHTHPHLELCVHPHEPEMINLRCYLMVMEVIFIVMTEYDQITQ